MKRTLIKICGVRDAATASIAAEAGADFVGVVLVPTSPRFVKPSDAPNLATDIADAGAIPVAVVQGPVNASTRAALDAFAIVQFHGSESLESLRAFTQGPAPWEVWKGLHFTPASAELWLASPIVTRVVLDGPDAGSGVAFDHGLVGALPETMRARTFLAGGLHAENVEHAVRTARPSGVDVSSGVESQRGVKDHAKIRAFIERVRDIDAS
jgi:phosphoribosylanthranilate isomerase